MIVGENVCLRTEQKFVFLKIEKSTIGKNKAFETMFVVEVVSETFWSTIEYRISSGEKIVFHSMATGWWSSEIPERIYQKKDEAKVAAYKFLEQFEKHEKHDWKEQGF